MTTMLRPTFSRRDPETTARRILGLALLALGVPAFFGCSSAPPDDLFFRGVMAGTSENGPISGTFQLLVFSPSLASQRKPGSPGSDPSQNQAECRIFLSDGTIDTFGGGYEGSKFVSLDPTTGMNVDGIGKPDNWFFTGGFSDGSTSGTFTGPNGAQGNFAGEDAAHQQTSLLCGTYEGSAGGTWNFVIAQSGDLSGAFAGDASGSLTGSASGSSVSIKWSGTDAFGGSASGSASGSLDASAQQVSGSWQGTDGSMSVSGTFQSEQMACPGPPPPKQAGASSECCGPDTPFPQGECCDHICCES